MSCMRFVSVGLIAVIATACTERITAPEAVRAIEELESPRTSKDLRRLGNLFQRMDWLGRGPRSPTLSGDSVTVLRDGRPRVFRAHVIERVMPPVPLDSADRCAHATLERRSALLWTNAAGGGGIWMHGGDYQRPLGRFAGNCSTLRLSGPEPSVILVPDVDEPDQNPWVSESGQGDISAGVAVGPCDFLDSSVVRELRTDGGVSCVRTRHTVTFHTVVKRGGRTERLELPPTQVDGLRYTIHCDARGLFIHDMCTPFDPHTRKPAPR